MAAAPDYATAPKTHAQGAQGAAPSRGVPQFATGGGSGELISDASVTLWRVGLGVGEPQPDEHHGSPATEASSSAAAGRGGVQEKRQKLGGAIEAGLEEGGGLDEPRDGAAKRDACVECVLCENADN